MDWSRDGRGAVGRMVEGRDVWMPGLLFRGGTGFFRGGVLVGAFLLFVVAGAVVGALLGVFVVTLHSIGGREIGRSSNAE